MSPSFLVTAGPLAGERRCIFEVLTRSSLMTNHVENLLMYYLVLRTRSLVTCLRLLPAFKGLLFT